MQEGFYLIHGWKEETPEWGDCGDINVALCDKDPKTQWLKIEAEFSGLPWW